ncbi:MAG TPA: FAD binding domain-containing protein [Terriglobales bacterium]|nr:FAD binding domain-containing protein [Terriglobales bacterium]
MVPEFLAPASVAEALRDLAGDGALAVGGGTQVGLLVRQGLIAPGRLVWLGRIGEMRGVAADPDGGLSIGAATTLAELASSPAVRSAHPALAEAAARVGNPRVRAVATLGGHLVHADPRQDLPPVLLALGAIVRLEVPGKVRRVPLRDFFAGPFETAVLPGELLTRIVVATPSPADRSTYVRFAPGSESDYPTVGVAVRLGVEAGLVRGGTIGLAGVHPHPLLVDLSDLAGLPPGPEVFASAGAAAAAACTPVSDQRGSADYKRAMAALWTTRALEGLLALTA